MTKWVFSTVLFLLTAGALAGVTSKGDSGFTLVITGEVMTTPVEAYEQFIRLKSGGSKATPGTERVKTFPLNQKPAD